MNLDQHIASLLENHDCVILPDFGGFVGNYASARINPINHRFDPPFRKISFNKLLTHNDGLLAAYVAEKNNEKYESAMVRVKDYVVYLRSELKTHKRIEFDRIGILYQLADGSFRFEQLKTASLFPEGFGLESFFSKTIERKAGIKTIIEPKPASVQLEKPQPKLVEPPKVIPISKPIEKEIQASKEAAENEPKKRTYWPAVAAAIALPIIGYSVWLAIGTPLLNNKERFHTSDLNPFSDRIETEYQQRNHAFESTVLENLENLKSSESAEFVTVFESAERDKTLVVSLEEKISRHISTTVKSELHYHIIGGCFSDENNASGLVEKFQNRGSNASVVDQKGALNRVSVASFATQKEALSALETYRQEIPNAWLLHK